MGKKPIVSRSKKPVEVEVANEEPLVVEVVEKNGKEHPPITVPKSEELTLPPTTTAQQDIVVAGQRTTSLLWESVQAAIAVSVTLATIYCAVFEINSETIVNAFFFIVATYFTRTNHTRIGGVGSKANEEPYRGR